MTARPGLSRPAFTTRPSSTPARTSSSRAVPYLEEGVAAGESVLAVLPEPRMRMIQESIGSVAEAVEFWPMWVVGRNPGRLIPAWRDFLAPAIPEKGVRGSGNRSHRGELGRGGRVRTERAPVQYRLWEEKALTVMCPYDTSTLDRRGPRGGAAQPSGLRRAAWQGAFAAIQPQDPARRRAVAARPPLRRLHLR